MYRWDNFLTGFADKLRNIEIIAFSTIVFAYCFTMQTKIKWIRENLSKNLKAQRRY